MRLKQLLHWLGMVYCAIACIIIVFVTICILLAKFAHLVIFVYVLVSVNLAILIEAIIGAHLYIYILNMLLNARNESIREHRNSIRLLVIFSLTCLPALITNIIVISVPHVAQTIYDAATFAITWAFVVPALILSGKSLLTGIFGVTGTSLWESATRTYKKNATEK